MADDEVYENQAFSHEESITRHEQVHLQTNGGRRNDRPQSYQTAVKEDRKSYDYQNNVNTAKIAPSPSIPQPPLWDVFEVKARGEYFDDSDLWLTLRRIAKVITIIFIAIIVVASGIMSKLCFTLITSNLNSAMECTNISTSSGECLQFKSIPYYKSLFDYTTTDLLPASSNTGAYNSTASSSSTNSTLVVTPTSAAGTTTDVNSSSSTNSTVVQSAFSISGVTETISEPAAATKAERSGYADKMTVIWTWALILFICFPYAFTFLRNLWRTISFTKPRWYGCKVLAVAVLTEVIHSVGVIILTTVVLPRLDLFHSVGLFLGLGIVPAILRALNKQPDSDFKFLSILLSVFALIGQITVLFAYPLLFSRSELVDNPLPLKPEYIGLLVSLLMISVRWWPNYFDSATLSTTTLSNAVLRCVVYPDGVKRRTKYKRMIAHSSSIVQVLVNAAKMVVTILGVTASVSILYNIPFDQFYRINRENVTWSVNNTEDKYDFLVRVEDTYPIFIALVGLSSALICYYIVLHAVKAKLIVLCYALPLHLLTPLTLLVIYVVKVTEVNGNMLSDLYPTIRFNMFDDAIFGAELKWKYYWIPLICIIALWFASQFISTFHMWTKPYNKVSSAESLFLLPMFDAECIEQSLLYNRKPTRQKKRMSAEDKEQMELRDRSHTVESLYADPGGVDGEVDPDKRNPHIPQIYFCATMWHENKKEMLLMMKSVLRMDFDHFQRRSSQILTKKVKADFYNFETHIFFDDAFGPHRNDGGKYEVNTYVKQLIEVVPDSCRKFYPKLNLIINDPVKVPTPYGGRLEWDLPSGSKLIAHLKDKVKIRHKKRWSQVMYMYYFLGELLMNNKQFNDDEKQIAARNTFLLALDGDVDFKPEAVLLLVDMMKKNERVGAACGRIHPIGSGPLIWYQKFEYAIAHWLQKATEHVLGCVLCSPGCFSLFRGEALMHENVMARYATTSTLARHYLQYDQGEDRWLCTLLLQAGYKVEYNAAADAFTFAPEGFDEFFNQRRRWGPSTMANIMDLIMDANHVIRVNSNMSLLYVIYQAVQFFASIIGPGTIFMMVTGALKIAIKLEFQYCFIINLLPNLVFIVVSFYVKSKTQLKMAKVMALIYALVMCLVLISIILDIRSNPCSPTAIFFFTVAGTFIVSAMLHPQEFSCVLHGVTYYVLIPCMYMLLIVYSFININNVSWGTREVVLTATEQQQAQQAAKEKAATEVRKKSIVDMVSSLWKGGDAGDTGSGAAADQESNSMACGNVCSLICCPKPKKEKEQEMYWQINKKLDKLTGLVYDSLLPNRGHDEVVTESDSDDIEAERYDSFGTDMPSSAPVTKSAVKRSASVKRGNSVKAKTVTIEEKPRDDLLNPHWSEDNDTGSGEVRIIEDAEVHFWENFIIKYLAPLDKSVVQQEKIENQLLGLRMNVNFGFFLTNAMFITIVYALQENHDSLSFPWPCGQAENTTENPLKAGETAQLTVEPLSLVFLVFFMAVLAIQFIGMVMHRLGTFWHILATTKLSTQVIDQSKYWENILKSAAQIDEDDIDELGSESESDDVKSVISDEEATKNFNRDNFIRRSRRTTKRILEKTVTPPPVTTTLEEALAPKIASLANDDTEALEKRFRKMSGTQRRATVKLLKSKDRQAKMSSLSIPNNHPMRQRHFSETAKISDDSHL